MLWLLVVVPFAVGGALLLAGRRADSLAAPVALVCTTLTLAAAVVVAAERPEVSASFLDGVPFGLRVDGLSSIMVVTVAVVLLAVLAFSTGEFGGEQGAARFFGFMLLFAGAMLVTVTATTLVSLLMAWEVMGAASYALIGFWWRDSHRVDSGRIAFLTTRGADLGLYLGAGAALAGGLGGLSLAELDRLPDGWRDLVAAGMLLAALGKSAQLPFSFWLSRAMDGPTPVSALLHSATMVAAGAYLLLRLEPLLSSTAWAGAVAAWTGALTALALGAVAVVQQDLKQLLAASTCAQVGFMVLAAGLGAVAAGSGQLLAHALTKSLLFLAAGAWLAALGTKSLPGLRGAARRYPVVGVSFTVGAVVLAGIPPLSIWVTKDKILAAALHESAPLYLAGLAAAALSAAYAGRAVALVWSTAPPEAEASEDRRRHRIISGQWGVLPPLAAGATLLGVFAIPAVWSGFADVVPGVAETGPQWWEALVSAAAAMTAAVAAAVVVRRRGDIRDRPRLRAWLGLESLAVRMIATPQYRAARVLARFDDRVVDGGVRAATRFGTVLARSADIRAERFVDAAVRLLAQGFRALGRLARKPQTGQLHHYYAQAVIALAALAVLLLVL